MGDRPISDQQSQRCPFLTETLKASTQCVKAANSRGVCTISATSNGPRQDWLVCPYRALDDGLLADIVKRLYGIPALDPVLIRPVVVLNDEAGRTEILAAISGHRRMFVYFQDKLGGEIGLSKTAASPELSFDITVVELTAGPVAESPPGLEQPGIRIGKYGVIELQTTDTHGSYQHAVTALTNALDLHAAGESRMGRPQDRGTQHLQRVQAHLLPDRLQVPGHQTRDIRRMRARLAPARLGLLAAVPRRPGPARANRRHIPPAR